MRRFFQAVTRLLSIIFVALLVLACVGPCRQRDISAIATASSLTAPSSRKMNLYGQSTDPTSWSRFLTIDGRFMPSDQDEPLVVKLTVDQPTYDSLTVGDIVQVRYAPNPMVRRLGMFGATSRTADLLRSFSDV